MTKNVANIIYIQRNSECLRNIDSSDIIRNIEYTYICCRKYGIKWEFEIEFFLIKAIINLSRKV